MRKLIATLTFALVVAPTLPARADATVVIANLAFSPSTLRIGPGESVTFSNTGYAVSHTSTSDDGFWDTRTIGGNASAEVAFPSAGTFRYHCAVHASMHGVVVVGLQVSPEGAVGVGTSVTLTFASTFVPGRGYVLERKRGPNPWKVVTLEPDATSFRFTPHRAGKVRFRATTVEDGASSRASPPVLVRVTAT